MLMINMVVFSIFASSSVRESSFFFGLQASGVGAPVSISPMMA
jgi:hypothetical protein